MFVLMNFERQNASQMFDDVDADLIFDMSHKAWGGLRGLGEGMQGRGVVYLEKSGSKKSDSEGEEIDSESVEEETEPLEELRGAKSIPSGYTFKTTKDAKDFVVALKHMGLKKNNVSQKGKTISVDLGRGRHHDTLVMIKNLAKDMKASISESNVIDAVREAYSSESGVLYTLKDLENIHILPEDAGSIVQVHDMLNGDNQSVLRDMLSETKESFDKVLNFCQEKCSKEQ